ncbi:MAG: gamma-glutamyltransferase family protein [Casimicrobiaceae bacterium]
MSVDTNRQDFDWQHSYPSRRSPLCAANAVATSQPLAAQAGIAMLANGGNAVDAAIATAIALTVVEPCSNGAGSDLFAILWDGTQLVGLNASGRSPAAWSPKHFAGKTAVGPRGFGAVTIPGAVSGWVALSQRFGKLPFADLFEPAIRYARDGYLVSPIIASYWQRAVPLMPHDLGFAEHFMPRGRAPYAGERFANPALANSLEKIAATHGDAFYRGELAQAMVRYAHAQGELHTLVDFAGHTADWVTPLAQDYRGTTIHQIPPNGQGIAALIALGILDHFDVAAHAPDSVTAQHLQIEAMKLGFADAYRYVADVRAMPFDPQRMLDPAYIASRAALVDPARAQDFGPGEPQQGGTVYMSAADESGMMVSLIQSNYMGFGSGVVVPGTGLSLQNRGAGFSLQPGHPNEVAGGKRPYHTIIPGFATRNGTPLAAFGVMGGPIQPPAHVQTLVRLLDYRMNPQAILDAPRWKIDGASIDLEASAASSLRDGLAAIGHRIENKVDSYMDFGAGQYIVRTDGGYLCGSDPRRDGQAVGF